MISGKFLFVILACTWGGLAKLAAQATPEALQQYRAWHEVCLQGNVDQIDQQIANFQQQLAAHPGDSLAKAFLGSAYALRAKFGKWPPSKLANLKRGRELMNEAIVEAPHDGRVRMVRAIAYYRIPKRFGVRETSLADFNLLVPAAQKKKPFTRSERQAILYYAALAYRDENIAGAGELMAQCRALDPDSSYGKLAQ
ncbi:hypothetical protein [Roseibacillus ishigakijimensis]|uniref:Lytic transglycosylase domain-containing protein n=1 Tax=Roseibacillus ishigakijimensis TaxID=454146 RepID=A0A934RTA9_9BACT|nr:hypothetical protein [Roseibacillus ishigakijimensis]MBK1835557.1 hypothetical protein [Roseibacillus ishigakijimensis]